MLNSMHTIYSNVIKLSVSNTTAAAAATSQEQCIMCHCVAVPLPCPKPQVDFGTVGCDHEQNGEVSDGGTCSVTCDSGFWLSDRALARCMDGVFSLTLSTCRGTSWMHTHKSQIMCLCMNWAHFFSNSFSGLS